MNTLYVKRELDVVSLLRNRSVFLLGPRQTGKSSYIQEQLKLPSERIYNLLDRGLLLRLMADPTMIRQEIDARDLSDCIICIDEIQKFPELLDEVQLMIEERRIRFLLTGSSARKLRRSGSDRFLHSFVYPEVRDHGFSLERAMFSGLLPPHYLSSDPEEELASYVDRYITEEIAAEGTARNLPAFARFLQTAATVNSQIVNFTNVGNDAQVPRQTVQQWFQVLKDTLLGFDLLPYTKTVKRKAIETSKFYFFDIGVVRFLRRLHRITPAMAEFGEFFEHFIFLELRSWIDYHKPRTPLHYWRSTSGFEVDFLLNETIAIEVKATKLGQPRHLKGLKALLEEGTIQRAILICTEPRPRRLDEIEIMPWEFFLDLLWNDRIL